MLDISFHFKRRLLFPRMRDFKQLFVQDPGPALYDPLSGMRCWRQLPEESGILIRTYCSIDGRNSVAVIPHRHILKRIIKSLVVEGSVHFKIVPQSDDTSKGLVLVEYDQILASRYLAMIDMATVPKDTNPTSVPKSKLGDVEQWTPQKRWVNFKK